MARAAGHEGLILLLFVMLAACAAGGEPGNVRSPGEAERTVETIRSSEPPSETTGPPAQPQSGKTRPQKKGKAGGLNVEQLASEAPGQGPKRPRVLLASSASELSRTADVRVSDAGEGIYLAAFWGEKPTGGYSLEIRSARATGNRVAVRVSLREPPPDAMVIQTLTHPYAVAVVRDADPAEEKFVLEDQRGRGLDWPVRSARSGG